MTGYGRCLLDDKDIEQYRRLGWIIEGGSLGSKGKGEEKVEGPVKTTGKGRRKKTYPVEKPGKGKKK